MRSAVWKACEVNIGPKPRVPVGGYLLQLTMRFASSYTEASQRDADESPRGGGGTYDSVTHGSHDTVCTLVEGTLDQPFLGDGDTDDGGDIGVRDGIVELARQLAM